MSNWSETRRRGGSTHQGVLPPPGTADWTWTAIADHKIQAAPTITPPLPAYGCSLRYRDAASTTWLYDALATNGEWNTPPLTPGNTYHAQLAWGAPRAEKSAWSTTKSEAAT